MKNKLKGFFPMVFFIGAMLVTGGGKAAAQAVKINLQNDTGFAINFIEVKLSASTSATKPPIWITYVSQYGSIGKGQKKEITLPQSGTYDIRIRTTVYNYITKSTNFYLKKNVRVTAGMTVNFVMNDRYTLTRADYQEFIQDRVKFDSPGPVWETIDKHSKPDDIYQAWALSYGNVGTSSRPSKSDKEIVLQVLDRNGIKGMFAAELQEVIATHRFADAFYQKWADSYFIKR